MSILMQSFVSRRVRSRKVKLYPRTASSFMSQLSLRKKISKDGSTNGHKSTQLQRTYLGQFANFCRRISHSNRNIQNFCIFPSRIHKKTPRSITPTHLYTTKGESLIFFHQEMLLFHINSKYKSVYLSCG